MLDLDVARNEIAKLRKLADLIIVSFHGGAEGVVKIEVVDYIPDSQLTFRWARL